LFLLTGLGGCSDSIPVVKVSGVVTYKGEPLEDASITFLPVISDGRVAVGITQSDGSFQLVTQAARSEGCLPGKYNITVHKTVLVDENGALYVMPAEPVPGSAPQKMPISKSFLPTKYGEAATSNLSAEVLPKGKNHFIFNLSDE